MHNVSHTPLVTHRELHTGHRESHTVSGTPFGVLHACMKRCRLLISDVYCYSTGRAGKLCVIVKTVLDSKYIQTCVCDDL